MSKASVLLTLRQKFLSNGSSCIPEFLFEERFNFSSKKKHEITNLCETLTCFSSPVEKKKKTGTSILFLAKRGAERRAARFIISSRAKRACITQASQGQRDFLLAINLSSLVGVRRDVIQLVTSERIMGFQATDCHRRQSFGFYS